MFLEGLDQCPAPMFADNFDSLDILTGITRPITVRQGQMVHESIHYTDDNLRAMSRSIAPSFRTDFKHVPSDLGYVYVQNPSTGEWVRVAARFPEYASGLSLTQHKLIRANVKGKLTRSNAEERLMESRLDLHDHWVRAISSGKRIKASMKKYALARNLSSIQTFDKDAALGEAPRARLVIEEPDASVALRDIPSFRTFSLEQP